MSASDHVLLIGIDAYDGIVTPLRGCVNDVDAIQRLLIDRLGVAAARITRLTAALDEGHETDVPEQSPTIDNIRAAFDRLASDAVQPGDRVFIYYSGHGTQAAISVGDKKYWREALIPKDQAPIRKHLFDWEINERLGRIAARTKSVTFVLDCCCSSGATRDILEPQHVDARVRFFPSPPVSLDTVPEAMEKSMRGVSEGLAGAVRECQVVAACLEDEKAMESRDAEGKILGELTRALISRLRQHPGSDLRQLRWGRIWRSIADEVSTRNSAQHPWMHGGFSRFVFGGPPAAGDAGFGVRRVGDEYAIDAGMLSGITQDALLGIYGEEPLSFPELDSARDVEARAGRVVRVKSATRAGAKAESVGPPFDLPEGARARLVAAGEEAKLSVALEPNDEAIAAALRSSPLIDVVEPGRTADMSLVRLPGQGWWIEDDVFGPGVADPKLAVLGVDRLDRVRAFVEHYYEYSRPIRFAKACSDLQGRLRITLLDGSRDIPEGADAQRADLPALPKPYKLRAGELVVVLLENLSEVDLSVTLFACSSDGSVSALGAARVPKNGFRLVWADEQIGNPFKLEMDARHERSAEQLIAIGTTKLDADLRFLEVQKTFADAILGDRDLDLGDRGAEQPEQWTSARAIVVTSRI